MFLLFPSFVFHALLSKLVCLTDYPEDKGATEESPNTDGPSREDTKAKKPKRTKENSKFCRDIYYFLLDLGGQFSPLLPGKQRLQTP